MKTDKTKTDGKIEDDWLSTDELLSKEEAIDALRNNKVVALRQEYCHIHECDLYVPYAGVIVKVNRFKSCMFVDDIPDLKNALYYSVVYEDYPLNFIQAVKAMQDGKTVEHAYSNPRIRCVIEDDFICAIVDGKPHGAALGPALMVLPWRVVE